jgi:hypothetical protein
MNTILVVGFLVITGYFMGRLWDLIDVPKIIEWIPSDFIDKKDSLLSINLAFITFCAGR